MICPPGFQSENGKSRLCPPTAPFTAGTFMKSAKTWGGPYRCLGFGETYSGVGVEAVVRLRRWGIGAEGRAKRKEARMSSVYWLVILRLTKLTGNFGKHKRTL